MGEKHSNADKAIFAKLKSVGFNGPIMVEGVKVGATAEEDDRQRARQYRSAARINPLETRHAET